MESRWWITLVPLALPIAAATAGGLASVFVLARFRQTSVGHGPALFALIILSVVAAWVPNAGQPLYDLGLAFRTIESLQIASYFIFAFAVFEAWHFLKRSSWRWALILLVPVSFAQPLLWTWAYIGWTTWGFAP